MKRNSFILPSIVLVMVLIALFFFLKKSTQQNPESDFKDTSLADVQKRGKIIIASDIEFEPMEFYDKNGIPAGLDIDIANEIANKLGVTAEIKMVYWDALFPAIKSGEADLIISSITILPEREKEMLFTNPYFDSGQVLLIRKNDARILAPSDLKGKKVGVFPDTSGKREISKYVDPENLIDYQTFEVPKDKPNSGILYDLRSGKIDVIITDYIGALGNVKNNPELKIAGEPFTQEYYGIVSRLGNETLIHKINEILEEMKANGKMREINKKWLNTY